MNILQSDEVPSDEEAQDSTNKKEVVFLDSRENQRRRRRSKSLHSSTAALPERIVARISASQSNTAVLLSGYESEPSDLSSASSQDRHQDALIRQAHRRVREEETELHCCQGSNNTTTAAAAARQCRRWPFRLLLLTCAYIAWTCDTLSQDDSFLVHKRDMPKASAAAFSSQHGREIPLQEQHSPLQNMSRKKFIPPMGSKPSSAKRRPNVAHAIASKQKAPVLGERLERFVMEDADAIEETIVTTSSHSSFYYLGYVALLLLFVETSVREVRRRTFHAPRQRLRNE